MKYTFVFFCFLLVLQAGHLENFMVVLVNHNTSNPENIKNIKHDKRLTTNLNNILRATQCKKKENKCGRKLKSKIVGGLTVDHIKEYPYHAKYGSSCGAAIIDKRWAVTAAHCGKKYDIMVGTRFLMGGDQIPILKHYFHPKWHMKKRLHEYDYDFQLLQLKIALVFSRDVQPIKFAHSKDLQVGQLLKVTGWGQVEYEVSSEPSIQGTRAPVLKVVEVPIVPKKECQRVKFELFQGSLTPRMFCAGYYKGEKDACQGDSGGAAAANGRLLGLVSFGYGCATPESYGVYSNILVARSWIEKTTGIKFA